MTGLFGCAGQQTLSNYARTGDTVAIAISPSEPNIFLRKEDINVTVQDVALNSFPIQLRNLVRIYSDPTSSYAIRSARKNGWLSSEPYEVQADPYQGYWIGIVDLIDPSTGLAPTLTPGAGQIVFSSTATGDDTFDIEILPGAGSQNPMEEAFTGLAPLEALEAMPQVEVAVGGAPIMPIGAGVFVLSYNAADFNGDATAPQIVNISPDQHIQLIKYRTDNGDGTTSLTVMLINPRGFKTNNTIVGNELSDGMSLFRDLRFSIVWDKTNSIVNDANWQNSLTLISSDFYDLEGNTTIGLVTSLNKLR